MKKIKEKLDWFILLPMKPIMFIIAIYYLVLISKNSDKVDFINFLGSLKEAKNEEDYIKIENDMPKPLVEHMDMVLTKVTPYLRFAGALVWILVIRAVIL